MALHKEVYDGKGLDLLVLQFSEVLYYLTKKRYDGNKTFLYSPAGFPGN